MMPVAFGHITSGPVTLQVRFVPIARAAFTLVLVPQGLLNTARYWPTVEELVVTERIVFVASAKFVKRTPSPNCHRMPIGKVPLRAWKAVVDAAVAGRSQLLAVAPSEIKKAVTDELAWFARIKANHYSKATPLGPWTVAEVGQITNFERTKCGIKF